MSDVQPGRDGVVLCCGDSSRCYYADGCRRPSAPSEPPAEAQQDDELGCWCAGSLHRWDPDGRCPARPVALPGQAPDPWPVARPSADTETLRRARELAAELLNEAAALKNGGRTSYLQGQKVADAATRLCAALDGER